MRKKSPLDGRIDPSLRPVGLLLLLSVIALIVSAFLLVSFAMLFLVNSLARLTVVSVANGFEPCCQAYMSVLSWFHLHWLT